MPNCRCPTPDFTIPGWTLSDYPQFVFFTLDDSITNQQFKNVNSLDFLLRSPNILDRKGCHPKLNFYVRQLETDFPPLNLIDKLGRVSLHTFSHSTSISTSASTWINEYSNVQNAINKLALIPLSRLRGSRAPYLQTNEAYFQALQSLGLQYDTSLIYSNAATKRFYWPFTLDYTIPEQNIFCYFGVCPQNSYPGLWEVPMSNFDYDVQGNVMDPVFDITNPTAYTAYLNKMKSNFLDSYNSNRAPRGVYTHWRYIDVGDIEGLDPLKAQFFSDFYRWVAALDNVVFATEPEVIEWMKNPVKFADMVPNCGDITPTVDDTCTQKTCTYSQATFKICGNICPSNYPGLNPVTGAPIPWTIDPESTQTNADQVHWLGSSGSYINTWVDTTTYNGVTQKLICANGHFEHQNSVRAVAAIVNFKVCDSLLDQSQPVYGVWGYPSDVKENNGNFYISYIVNNVNIAAGGPGLSLTDGFCLRAKDQAAMDAWSQNSAAYISFGADWYSDPLTCIIGNCKVWCGDGTCDATIGEDSVTCPMDCKTGYSCGSTPPPPDPPTPTPLCNTDNCKMPNCRCITEDFVLPGWTLNDYPQFVFFTLDDSITKQQFKNVQNLDFILKNPSIVDKKMCKPKMTFYVRQLETDFTAVNLVNKFGDVSIHTFSHSTTTSTSATTWLNEQSTVFKAIEYLAQVPSSEIQGSRAPYLQTNEAYFSTLKSMNLLYDSSMTYNNKATKRFYWPFTLDFGAPSSFCKYGICPTNSYPGLWEVPMANFDYLNDNNVMDPVFQDDDAADYLAMMKSNFLDSYNSNRAPRGVYWHWRYISSGDIESLNPVKVQVLVDFYTWVATLDNVVFATEAEVIKWMKNPVKFADMVVNCPDTTTTIENTCTSKKCYYQEASFEICGSTCPSVYPGPANLNGWTLDPTQLQTNKNVAHWLVSNNARSYLYGWGDNSFGEMLMCMGGHFEHSNSKVAKSALVSIKICNSLVDPVNPVFGIWGYTGGYTIKGGDFVVRYLTNGVSVRRGTAGLNIDDGFCLRAKDINAYNKWVTALATSPFVLSSFGVDFFDQNLNCEIFNCKVYCGDGVCQSNENKLTCPYDCNTAGYVCPASARRFLERIKGN